jgi:hypothetical protein
VAAPAERRKSEAALHAAEGSMSAKAGGGPASEPMSCQCLPGCFGAKAAAKKAAKKEAKKEAEREAIRRHEACIEEVDEQINASAAEYCTVWIGGTPAV